MNFSNVSHSSERKLSQLFPVVIRLLSTPSIKNNFRVSFSHRRSITDSFVWVFLTELIQLTSVEFLWVFLSKEKLLPELCHWFPDFLHPETASASQFPLSILRRKIIQMRALIKYRGDNNVCDTRFYLNFAWFEKSHFSYHMRIPKNWNCWFWAAGCGGDLALNIGRLGNYMGGGTRGVVLPLPLLHPMIMLILPLLWSLLERKSMGSRLAFLKLFLSLWFSISRPNHFFTIYWTQSTLKAIDIQTKGREN